MAKQTFTAGQVLTATQVNALQANDYNQTVSTKTTSYVLVAGDVGTRIVMNSATDATITVNTSLFSAGDTLWIHNIGTGLCTVTAGTATVTTSGSLVVPTNGGGLLYFTSAGAAIYFPTSNIDQTVQTSNRNKIINGGFDIWQRGTSFTPSVNAYTADRWEEDASNAYPTSQTISQQTFTPGTAPVSGYEGQFFLRFAYTYATGNGGQFLTQKVENVRTLAGQTATVSFWAKAGSAISMNNATLRQNFGSGGSTTVETTVGAASLTTSWQRFSFTVSVPSVAGKTIGTNSFLELRLFMPATSSTTDIWGVQLEAGAVATPFEFEDYGVTLAKCQRYYYLQLSGTGKTVGSGTYYTATNLYCTTNFPVTMRTTPTLSATSGTNYYAVYSNGVFDYLNSFTIDTPHVNGASLFNNTDASGVAGHGAFVATSDASASIAFNAEL